MSFLRRCWIWEKHLRIRTTNSVGRLLKLMGSYSRDRRHVSVAHPVRFKDRLRSRGSTLLKRCGTGGSVGMKWSSCRKPVPLALAHKQEKKKKETHMSDYDLLIRGGTIVDGTRMPRYQ